MEAGAAPNTQSPIPSAELSDSFLDRLGESVRFLLRRCFRKDAHDVFGARRPHERAPHTDGRGIARRFVLRSHKSFLRRGGSKVVHLDSGNEFVDRVLQPFGMCAPALGVGCLDSCVAQSKRAQVGRQSQSGNPTSAVLDLDFRHAAWQIRV